MKNVEKEVGLLLKQYSISRQKRIMQMISQTCRHIPMGQTTLVLENTHVHPHGINYSKLHQHRFLEIHVPYSGAGLLEAEGKKNHFRLGEFTVNPPGQVHCWEMTKAPLPMLIFWIRIEQPVENMDPMDQLLSDFMGNRGLVYPLPDDFFISCRRLFAEAASPRIGIEFALQTGLAQIILSLARATVSTSRLEQKMAVEPQDRAERLTWMIDQFLKTNLHEEVHLGDIARQVSVGTRTLTRLYINIKGHTIGEELNRLRMYHAEELLRETDLPIKTVAWECGVPDQRYFTRKFKQFFDESPTEFRSKLIPT